MPEDRVWSVLGLFEIWVPAAYGIGMEKACQQLLKAVKEQRSSRPLGEDATLVMADALERLENPGQSGCQRGQWKDTEDRRDGNKDLASLFDIHFSPSQENDNIDGYESGGELSRLQRRRPSLMQRFVDKFRW